MMKKRMRKDSQIKLTNPKNAGRIAIHDKGIRHTKREEILRPSPLHLTIKLKKANIQNKVILNGLRHAIMRARLQGLKIIHFSLEKNHVHLYVESQNNEILGRAMKAFGVSLVKKINRHFKTNGSCYKTRYHLHILRSATEVKRVIHYILNNGIKHRRTSSLIDPYNSSLALHDPKLLEDKLNWADIKKYYQSEILTLINLLDDLVIYRNVLRFVQ